MGEATYGAKERLPPNTFNHTSFGWKRSTDYSPKYFNKNDVQNDLAEASPFDQPL